MKKQNKQTNPPNKNSTPNSTKASVDKFDALPLLAYDKNGCLIAGLEVAEAVIRSGKTVFVRVVAGLDSIEDLMNSPETAPRFPSSTTRRTGLKLAGRM